MQNIRQIDTNTLQAWLEKGTAVSILDIRPIQERMEWFIPRSIHFDAYDKLKAGNPAALQGLHLDKTVPVVAICAGGKTSTIAAALLQNMGFEAYSLKDGMRGWSLSWNTARVSFADFEVIQFRRTGKGCLSYLIASNNEAIVLDASLPIQAYLGILQEESLTLKYVIETHIHAVHLSRSKKLAATGKAGLYLPSNNKVAYSFIPVNNDTVFKIGNISLKAIETPGHTLESISFLIGDSILFTGDTLFVNGVGRPDLKASNDETIQRSKLLYQSIRKLLALNEKIIVFPAHTGKPVDFDDIPVQTTLAAIKETVKMVQLGEQAFIKEILQHIPPAPPNYLAIVAKNIQGDFSGINPVDLEAGANRCAIS